MLRRGLGGPMKIAPWMVACLLAALSGCVAPAADAPATEAPGDAPAEALESDAARPMPPPQQPTRAPPRVLYEEDFQFVAEPPPEARFEVPQGHPRLEVEVAHRMLVALGTTPEFVLHAPDGRSFAFGPSGVGVTVASGTSVSAAVPAVPGEWRAGFEGKGPADAHVVVRGA